ncbi:hypothetical protein TRFO_29888 [Tritrichomonas foetus]|uniref:Uncharacterized protein n=1 Tax=Tritrichomonas foetus TaxID=1144522 RepID=A0A1J4JVU3_9EUKA|nr:hypothetical protein TRFO_29888 [Tritrichomonas foetus]|eukprot:OHT02826.1 hypothetical protein TRFO_29888 [Tritrichomonas foetus]
MFEFTIDALSLLRKNEENNMKILSLESQLHASKTSLRQIDDLKMQCNEQKNEIYGLKINNEDLRNRLEISLHSNEELIKKHNDEINSINSHRIAEISQIRNHFFEKDREKEAMISKLKKEIDKMKKEKNNQLLDMMKIFQNQSSKDNKNDAKSENNQNAPFSIHIQKKNEENPNLKWKNKYNEEKRKRKELKKENEQLIQNSEMQQKTINELKHQLEEKQNQVNSLQTETSIIQHEIRQSIGHSIISEDSNISEIQSNNLQSLKLKLSKALSVIDEVKNSNEILSNNVI